MDNWLKQTKDKPLYPDVIWSKPENKNGAGKLLIIGGSSGNFAKVARAFSDAEKAGVGTIHLIVPESLRSVTKQIPFIDYAPSNPSGGFSRTSLTEILEVAKNVDGVLLAGDMGKNSETSLMLEDLISKYEGLVIVDSNSLDSFDENYKDFFDRENTIIFANQGQLRNILIKSSSPIPFTADMPKNNLAKLLREFGFNKKSIFLFDIEPSVWIVKNKSLVESTDSSPNPAKSSVWTIQQPEKLFQSLVCSVI